MQRSELYDELYSDGQIMLWPAFVSHLGSVEGLQPLSAHRTLLQDLLRVRRGQEVAYDWRTVDGYLPFEAVSETEIEFQIEALSARIGLELAGSAEFYPVISPEWTFTRSVARWVPLEPSISPIANAMGRTFSLGCPIRNGIPHLLYEVDSEVRRGLLLFGPSTLPDFDSVWQAAARLIVDAETIVDGVGPSSVILSGSKVGDITKPEGSSAILEVKVKPVGESSPSVSAASAPYPFAPSSLLYGTCASLSAELRAWRAESGTDQVLFASPAGQALSLSGGSLVAWNGSVFLTPPLSDVPRPSPLMRRAVSAGGVREAAIDLTEMDSFEETWVVGPEGDVSHIDSVDQKQMTRPLEDGLRTEQLRQLLGLS